MKYHHTARFQFVLQKALRLAKDRRMLEDYSDSKMLIAAGAGHERKKSTLQRFRKSDLTLDENADKPIDRIGQKFLTSLVAGKLWDYLDNKLDLIERAIALENVRKTSLYPLPEVANAIHSFYGVSKNSNRAFADSGIDGYFFCYKPSNRREGFIVKSRLKIQPANNDFFHVEEVQRNSGHFEMDKGEIIERSEGFGIVKSTRLWLFLRDVETDEPRVFCLQDPKHGQGSRATAHSQQIDQQRQELWVRARESKNAKITSMFGYLIEGVERNEHRAFSFNVVLISEDCERDMWKEKFLNKQFNPDDHVDVYPTAPPQQEMYADLLKEKKPPIPPEVIGYLALNKTSLVQNTRYQTSQNALSWSDDNSI